MNQQPEDLTTPRSLACLRLLRSYRSELESADPSLPRLSTFPLRIVSVNNFPTAAGLASSAAGFAALIRAIADLYQLPQSPTDLSRIARQGSGSACRSLMGGYVAWDMGEAADGSDSCARMIAPRSYWPSIRALILVVSAAKKGISSTAGMQATCATSALFKTRTSVVVPHEMAAMQLAIQDRDFASFAKITMRESNSFHASCLDTDPPIFYLNDVSRAAIKMVEMLNERAGKAVAAYTFDAGPNAVIYYLEENEGLVLGSFKTVLSGVEGFAKSGKTPVKESSWANGGGVVEDTLKAGVSRVIMTGVGDGPISVQNHLIDEEGEIIKGS